MQGNCRVHVVDDDAAMLLMLRRLLDTIGVEVRAFASAADFFAGYTPHPCECLVTDMRMPGMDGLEVQRRVLDRQLDLPIIFISGYAEVGAAVEAMRNGAFDFIEKPFGAQQFLGKVQKALELSRENHARHLARSATEARLALLTPKEREIVRLVVDGKSSREAAELLGISVRTVENHRARIMDKLHVASLVELVKLFV